MSANGDKGRASRALDAANFFLADAATGSAPILPLSPDGTAWDEARRPS